MSNTILKQLEVKEKEVTKLERKIARMKIEIRSLNRTKNGLIYLWILWLIWYVISG